MSYDSGEVLQGLHVQWTFLGATLMEWGCGFVAFLLTSTFVDPSKVGIIVPFMVAGMVSVTVSLAMLRKQFPDEERGMRNAIMTYCGFKPIDIPAPASFQPIWSGAPLKELDKEWRFTRLGLDESLPTFKEQFDEAASEEEFAELVRPK